MKRNLGADFETEASPSFKYTTPERTTRSPLDSIGHNFKHFSEMAYKRKRTSHKRTYRRRGGLGLPLAVSLVARDAAYKLKAARLKADMEKLGYSNAFVRHPMEKVMSDRYDVAMSRGGRIHGRGLYSGGGDYLAELQEGEKVMGALGKAAPHHHHHHRHGVVDSGSGFSHWFGKGDYTPSATHSNNLVSMGGASVNGIPQISSSGDETGSISICHREYISDVFAPGVAGGSAISFASQVFSLNPALQATFPFLSQIAENYDEYEFEQLLFTYRSTTTDIGNSTNGQCGTVIMATNYNAASSPWTDKQQMLEYAHAHDCKITEHMVHGVECDPAKSTSFQVLYTRTNPVVTNQDLKTYDKGFFQISIANCPAAYNGFPIGELWVDYTVTLRKPKLFSTRGLGIDGDIFYNSYINAGSTAPNCTINSTGLSSAFGAPQSSLTTQDPFVLVGQQNNIGVLYSPASSSGGNSLLNLVFPASYTGALSIKVWLQVPSTVNEPLAGAVFTSVVVSGNITPINDIYNPVTGLWTNSVSTTDSATGVVILTLTGEFHVFVSSATQGTNNVLRIAPPAFASATNSAVVAVQTQIAQYFTGAASTQTPSNILYHPNYLKGSVLTAPS